MRKIEERVEIIPNPTYGYARGRLLEHNKIDDSLRAELIERDLDRLVYVGRLGRANCAVSFMCEVNGCTCRYRTRYTRWYKVRGEDCDPLAELRVGRVAIQKDILDKHLEEEEASEGEKRLMPAELDLINQ